MLIYVNGDSFVAGAGLADHKLFAECPSQIPVGEFRDSNWPNTRYNLSKKRQLIEVLDNTNREMAWPSHLQRILGNRVLNSAMPGSSIHGIVQRTIYDIEKLIYKNQIPDYVLIGITGIDRVMLVNTDPQPDPKEWIQSALPNRYKNTSELKQKYLLAYWQAHTDEELLIFFLRECLFLKSYINSKIGKDPIFLNTSGIWKPILEIVKHTKLDILTSLWNMLNFNSVFVYKALGDYGNKYPKCADGHWSEPAHIEYAHYVAETFIQQNN